MFLDIKFFKNLEKESDFKINNFSFKLKEKFESYSGNLVLKIKSFPDLNTYIIKIFKKKEDKKKEITNHEFIKKILGKHIPELEYINLEKSNFYISEYIQPSIIKHNILHTLRDWIVFYCEQDKPGDLELFLRKIFWQIFLVIEKLHKNNIFHCDIHDTNILVTEDAEIGNESVKYRNKYYKVVLIDFNDLKKNRMCKHVNCKNKHRNANFLYSIINSCSTSYLKDINEKGCIKIVDSIVDKIYKSYPENRKEKIDFYYFINIMCGSSIIDFYTLLELCIEDKLSFRNIIKRLLNQ